MNPSIHSKKVLIVEDEAPILKILSEKFNSEGFTVMEAMNGEDGLKSAIARKPDLIILDIVMPKMDGLTMLKRLRTNKWGKSVPAIIYSNLNLNEKVFEAKKSGATDFLVKTDYGLDDLLSRVKLRLKLVD
jgi:DNA-binding response OmpR family regulator